MMTQPNTFRWASYNTTCTINARDSVLHTHFIVFTIINFFVHCVASNSPVIYYPKCFSLFGGWSQSQLSLGGSVHLGQVATLSHQGPTRRDRRPFTLNSESPINPSSIEAAVLGENSHRHKNNMWYSHRTASGQAMDLKATMLTARPTGPASD